MRVGQVSVPAHEYQGKECWAVNDRTYLPVGATLVVALLVYHHVPPILRCVTQALGRSNRATTRACYELGKLWEAWHRRGHGTRHIAPARCHDTGKNTV